jgi:hypothetical protein
VIPVWWSFNTGIGEARARARIIRRPNRGMSLEESAVEQRFLRADTVLIEADAACASALEELAAARDVGAAKAAPPRWLRRRRTQVERSEKQGRPPAA